jgi:oxygen-independent coproporphyrinogen-3 oxidase
MAGIYIHIPFCRSKCHYCNFFSVASVKNKKQILDSLREEIFLQRNFLEGKEIQSIYFGGGTPSVLDPIEINQIEEEINKYYPLSKNAEITLEANPDDLYEKKIREYMKTGINRISIGVQSFHDDDLSWLNRIHSASQALNVIKETQSAGINNISIDLIYGIPGLTNEKWEQNLETAFKTGVQHISAYSLTVEPRTALDVLIQKKKLPAPEEEMIIDHFKLLMSRMKEKGFIHYEISNFCMEGFYSKHNSMYWSGEHYLGLGPSAHSFNGLSRQWNVSGIQQYIENIRRKERWFDFEILTLEQKYNEYVMTSLRTMWGCDTGKIRKEFGNKVASRFSSLVSRYLKSGEMIEKGGVHYLTDEGKLFADGIAAELFMET